MRRSPHFSFTQKPPLDQVQQIGPGGSIGNSVADFVRVHGVFSVRVTQGVSKQGELPIVERSAVLQCLLGSRSAPNRAELAARLVLPELAPTLRALGLRAGDPVFVRIFKAERELELWMFHRRDRRFRLFRTYPVAGMSGRLGPKLAVGDRPAPEGFYFVNRRRMNPHSSYHLSFNLGYPNAYSRPGLDR